MSEHDMTTASAVEADARDMTAEIAELRAKVEAATPGPWSPSIGGYQILTGDRWNTICVFHSSNSLGWNDHRRAHWENGEPAKTDEANAFFVAAAVNALPRLLDLIERLAGAESLRIKERDESEANAIALGKQLADAGRALTASRAEGDRKDAEIGRLREAASNAAMYLKGDPEIELRAALDQSTDATHQRARAENGGR